MLVAAVMGTAKAMVRKGFAAAIPLAFAHEQDDIRATGRLFDVAASSGRIG